LSIFLLIPAKKKLIIKKTLIDVLLVAAKNLIKEQNPNQCSDCCSKEEPDQLVHHF